MAICTFFGHRDTPKEIRSLLKSTIIDLIVNKKVMMFYIGNHGNFDKLVIKTLQELKIEYSQIDYAVVLAYIPNKSTHNDTIQTIYPEGIELTPPRFAIAKRNKWMVNISDYVIAYITHSFGGAWQYTTFAEKKGKLVINLADKEKAPL